MRNTKMAILNCDRKIKTFKTFSQKVFYLKYTTRCSVLYGNTTFEVSLSKCFSFGKTLCSIYNILGFNFIVLYKKKKSN